MADQEKPSVDTDIFKLASIGDLALIKVLVDGGMDVNSVDAMTCTPLIWASRSGSAPVVEYLLEKGANPETAGYGGMRAIHHVSNNLQENALIKLLDVNAQVDCIRPTACPPNVGADALFRRVTGGRKGRRREHSYALGVRARCTQYGGFTSRQRGDRRAEEQAGQHAAAQGLEQRAGTKRLPAIQDSLQRGDANRGPGFFADHGRAEARPGRVRYQLPGRRRQHSTGP